MKKSILRRLALGACSLVVATAAVAADKTPMTIATGVDPSFAAFYLASTEGIFDRNGLNVRVQTGSSGSAMVAFLVKNTVQAAFGAEQAGMANFNLDSNVVVVAEGTETNDLYSVVAKNAKTVADLKGKRIGVARGTGSEVFWNSAIKALKLDPKDYTVVQVETPEMVAALERGNIDAFIAWEPWPTRATLSVAGASKILGQKGVMDSRVFVYMNKGWAAAHPDAARFFVKSLDEATRLINERPDYAADKVSQYLKLDRKLTGALMAQYSYGLKLSDASVQNLVMVSNHMKEVGKLAKPIDWSGFIYDVPLKAVKPSSVTYKLP